jgi:iron complex transport system ATP-binding protein
VTPVVLDQVSVAYEKHTVVRALDLTVGSGEWVALIGPNGAGKTTLLRAIAGLVPHTGCITVGGDPLCALSQKSLARRIAFVHQDPLMPAGMAVAQYVLLGRSPHLSYLGRESGRDRRIAADVLRRLNLGSLADRTLDQLSGGERQRAAIARALAQQAAVLLLDEPTSSLDLGRQQEVLELVDTLRRKDELTVIAAMHDLTLASQFANRLALVVDGTLLLAGSPTTVITEEAIARHYGARVRVLPVSPSGHAVVPIRAPAPSGYQEEVAP